ncbi:MAG: methionine ABC transporter ATP-binding protein [Bdellovibrio sp. CG12_big_fil_rev_8_21_14_0_65_39_13]|nr:MAG: methionine ABC transporter ATP-binding protein [Bdellovibrio sp. CG22_combo_CG10-13_8_21_14_all_39_27]PIQ58460.1 MAG: methionine ABC transporter ATP-binding protein [Bdellovibrio sp. CG12_big_fil_rev_8_21_14_0_65_39_13]PIR35413.1 MAG: methionine ABC transporter ATP-binding protein [Bdellovibrio sp. CG11_big_fil_rev_8_21_14_0_20_39_38]
MGDDWRKRKRSKMSAIQLNHLKFHYTQGPLVLDIPELKIEQSEKVFIHGPSGTGKSTFLNLVSGILSPSQGDLLVLNQNLANLSAGARDQFRGKNIGYIFQSFNLIPYLTIKDNILLGQHFRKSDFNIEHRADQLAKDLNISAHYNKKATQLSLGQQQRVACARALIQKPQLVIADEPTSSLDDKNTIEFMNLLIKEWEELKFTLVFVSHDLTLARYFDRTIALEEINKVVSI